MEGWRSNFPGPAKTSTEDLWVPKIEPRPAPSHHRWLRSEHGASSRGGDGRTGRTGRVTGTSVHCQMSAAGPWPVQSRWSPHHGHTGPGHEPRPTASHQWQLIMLNIHHDQWSAGVLIRRQPTGHKGETSFTAGHEAERAQVRTPGSGT